MNKSFFYKGLLIILVGIGLSSQSSAVAPAYDNATKAGDIVGQLNMCLGLNEGLRVYISGSSFEAITDSVGNFKISYAQPGTYNLTITQNGNNVGLIPNVTVISKQTANIGTVSFCLDNDGDGYAQDVDCDDTNALVHPDADEKCDGIDNNCDGLVDEGFGALDWDGTFRNVGESCGTGACDGGTIVCLPNGTGAVCSTDSESSIEVCGDGIDNNCNGETDEEGCATCTDNDNDGFYVESYCAGGFVDCDDTNASVNPGAIELCDGIDNNCDGRIDNVLLHSPCTIPNERCGLLTCHPISYTWELL